MGLPQWLKSAIRITIGIGTPSSSSRMERIFASLEEGDVGERQTRMT
jgi:hypothetical protein